MRIAIVNDVKTVAEGLRRIIAGIPSYQVAWMAADGVEAVERCKLDTPDLILMDLVMPVMNGVEATRRIMAKTPCPILLVTSSMQAHCTQIFEALGVGALDVTQTPAFGDTGQNQGVAALRLKIETVRRLASDKNNHPKHGVEAQLGAQGRLTDQLVVVGASAGGPAAIASILGALPQDFSAAIVIVQHVDAEFVPLMVSWLNERSAVSVRIARQGDRPQAGHVLIAGTSDHLVFTTSRTLGYAREPRNTAHSPSIDVFFDSVVRHWKGPVAGVLLTGMGRDGAQGLKALRDDGALTIAQDAATCVVYGMPKAAEELKAATKIMPLTKIAEELTAFARNSLVRSDTHG